MNLSNVEPSLLRDQLASEGVSLDLGGARVRVRSDAPGLSRAISRLYGDFPWRPPGEFHDATVAVLRVRGARRWFRPQVELVVDGECPFEPFPADTAMPLLEWGMNHALAERMGFRLLLHAGVVEKGDIGVVLPAIPGSGKSTLTAALMCRGYRLLSDEFGVVSMESGRLFPMVRPVALKNESIAVIRALSGPDAIGPEYPKTRKGTVAHLKPSAESVCRSHQQVRPSIVLFPKYSRDEVSARLESLPPETAFTKLSVNSFNYEFLGASSFDAVARIVRDSVSFRIIFSDLMAAVSLVDRLVEERQCSSRNHENGSCPPRCNQCSSRRANPNGAFGQNESG